MTRDQVDTVARGRVWTGADARDGGLVDELGGLRDAVRIARERADLDEHAPLKPAAHVPALARLGRPRNSDDPRVIGASSLGLDDIAALLGWPAGTELRMPPLTLR